MHLVIEGAVDGEIVQQMRLRIRCNGRTRASRRAFDKRVEQRPADAASFSSRHALVLDELAGAQRVDLRRSSA